MSGDTSLTHHLSRIRPEKRPSPPESSPPQLALRRANKLLRSPLGIVIAITLSNRGTKIVSESVGLTAKFADEPAKKAPGARIHGCRQHEAGGGHGGAGDRDHSVFQRLPQDFQHIALEFRQLVEKQHAVMGRADPPEPRNRTAANQTRVGNGMIKGRMPINPAPASSTPATL